MLTWNKASPALADATVGAGLDATRANLMLNFLGCAFGAGPMDAGWTLTINGSVDRPTSRAWTKPDGQKILISFTYSSGNIIKTRIQYDEGLGAGYESVIAWNETLDSTGYTTGGSTTTS